MRKDFVKVFSEHERSGSKNKYGHFRAKVNSEFEDFGGKVGMKRSHGMARVNYSNDKTPTFNQRLIKNFLQSRTGKQWDEVYSEICSHIKGKSFTVNFVHAYYFTDFVDKTAIIHDGEIYFKKWNGYEHISEFKSAPFFVHPQTGVLEQNPVEYNGVKSYNKQYNLTRAEKRDQYLAENYRRVDKDNELRKIGDIWYIYTWVDELEPSFVYRGHISSREHIKIYTPWCDNQDLFTSDFSHPFFRQFEIDSPQQGRIRAEKKTAPRSLLKKFNIYQK